MAFFGTGYGQNNLILVALGTIEASQVLTVADLQTCVDGGADVHLGHTVDQILVNQSAVLDAVTASLEGLLVFACLESLLEALDHELNSHIADGSCDKSGTYSSE